MCSPVHKILLFLRRSAHNIKQLDKILAKTITTSLIHTTTAWNWILIAYSKSPIPIKAILIYNNFITSNSICPDNYTYPSVLKACTRILSLAKGKEVHAHITKIGLNGHIYVQNALIHLYSSTAQMTDAHLLFDTMSQRDITSWNTLLAAYSTKVGSKSEVLPLFRGMLHEGIRVNEITLVILVTTCAQVRGIEYGRAVHAYVIKVGCICHLNLENALLGLYAKCREMNGARKLFTEMDGRSDVVSQTILINGYMEIGFVDMARDIFDRMVDKDIVLWNSMIHGYVKGKRPNEALALFKKMESGMVKPDETTIVCVLAACASISDLQYGRYVHQFVLQNSIRQDIFVKTALIDMYLKCGSLDAAMVIFYKTEEKDVFTWTTVIEGLANYGHQKEALRLFYQMEKHGIKPNEATFVSILTACRQSGLVEEGCFLFSRMVGLYDIQPKIEHLGCLIDLLSKAGLLHQAEEFINIMPPDERLVAYKTLLSACRSYSNIDLGSKVANELVKLGSQSHEVYILLSNFYALAGDWATVEEKRRIMKKVHMTKEPGISSIEMKTDLKIFQQQDRPV
ncbi:pentatricopeptide repeat-containing protein At2g29760, chloroplastic-like [Cornus florida]|uniref:pentatricopeptide repeat-containing protein At2g29760, chloroplastic-like n=1 Tax=Cornus florida TaxID=4283 RepID=UPI002897BB2F|nr:pentatricopeptide repeat-containing protein At2g29760, chloroplastic-like [Cornus florida]